ncbi:MAG: hypothetical protein JWN23_2131 [Rhodocyclales bacterium]|nr:hypothetical protein [Rhodocyclales bacterium]
MSTPRHHPLPPEAVRARPVFSTRKPRRAETTSLSMLDRVLQSVTMAVTLTAILVFALNPLTALWQSAMNSLVDTLSLNAQVISHGLHIGQTSFGMRLGVSMESPAPDKLSLMLQAVMCFGVFGMTWAVLNMPLRWGLRILCVLHALGLLMIVARGDQFPYSLLDHTRVLYDSSLIWLLLTPGLLAAGFFLVERSWLNRLVAAMLILGFEIIALPLKLILHSVLVALLSPAVIPLLFLAAGPVLDILLLAALYAWVLTWRQLKFKLR